jgi:hypothetical protein
MVLRMMSRTRRRVARASLGCVARYSSTDTGVVGMVCRELPLDGDRRRGVLDIGRCGLASRR